MPCDKSPFRLWVRMTGIDVFCFILISLSSFSIVAGICDSNGLGSTECVLLDPYYHKYQWATCLTDTYIKTFSKGRHQCMDVFATYCWYQCMMEVHNDLGHVYDDCACGSDAPANLTTQPTVVTPAIPDWCFSPSGDNCNWYTDCLEKRFPCKQSGSSYAIDYAEKFCNLYKQHVEEFDSTGQQWIDGVRKCLQVNLVPILRPFVTKTCSQIKQMAFDSHPGCYLHPSDGKPSICDIGVSNWARVFWTVKSAVTQAPVDTFKQMIEVMNSCGKSFLIDGMQMIQMTIKQTVTAAEEILNRMSDEITKTMSDKLNWDKQGILYFGYPSNETKNERKKRSTHDDGHENTVFINVLLAEGSKFDLNAGNDVIANVTQAAIDVAKAIEKGDVWFNLEDGMNFTTLSVCKDVNCTESSLQIVPAPPKTSNTAASPTFAAIWLFAGMITEFFRRYD